MEYADLGDEVPFDGVGPKKTKARPCVIDVRIGPADGPGIEMPDVTVYFTRQKKVAGFDLLLGQRTFLDRKGLLHFLHRTGPYFGFTDT